MLLEKKVYRLSADLHDEIYDIFYLKIGQIYLINVTNYIDAVDYNRAIVKTLLGKYRVSFDKIAFKSDFIENNYIFKVFIDDIRYSTEIFVSEQFRCLVLDKDLTGFKFE